MMGIEGGGSKGQLIVFLSFMPLVRFSGGLFGGNIVKESKYMVFTGSAG